MHYWVWLDDLHPRAIVGRISQSHNPQELHVPPRCIRTASYPVLQC